MTSVEWLLEEMLSKGYFKESVTLTNIDHLQYKAEELHKQDIIDAVDSNFTYSNNEYPTLGEQYYHKTFVSKGSNEHIVEANEMIQLPKYPSVISENGNELLFDKKGNLIKELPKQETLYTEKQVREVAKYTISEWASLNEQREHDHEKLVKTWLSIELQNFIQSLKQPKKD